MGYFGAITYSGVPDYREYFGVEFLEPLEIGEEYHVSFHASLSFEPSGVAILASNNLGVLLMTQNYIPITDGFGTTLNFAHYRMESASIDTTNWKKFSFQLIAGSAYTQIVFGNFYDDASTGTLYPFIWYEGGALASYFLDDFCVAKDSTFCPGVLNVSNTLINSSFSLFPNPCIDYLKFKGEKVVRKIEIWSASGSMLISNNKVNSAESILSIDLDPGLYFARFYAEEGILTKRFVVH